MTEEHQPTDLTKLTPPVWILCSRDEAEEVYSYSTHEWYTMEKLDLNKKGKWLFRRRTPTPAKCEECERLRAEIKSYQSKPMQRRLLELGEEIKRGDEVLIAVSLTPDADNEWGEADQMIGQRIEEGDTLVCRKVLQVPEDYDLVLADRNNLHIENKVLEAEIRVLNSENTTLKQRCEELESELRSLASYVGNGGLFQAMATHRKQGRQ